ncbi:FAD-dependent monooxygenase [Bradyrhizobium sp. SSUT18]|uniref:FAD-dependent monooxygenase n=1 Tax=Bradyrhizobium sp. SSUT18 TaxID=3040602 RepID=UPI00244765BB|nr:FAD-dependent monooxygenase [Bradyrhizobium sp. SSUT18]MDH2401841.1 FAD-dependent monooxygenase [Bradyrhizobium sp. SSUT18]
MRIAEKTFVLIVGREPTCLTAAIDLSQRGVPGILVTENRVTTRQPRCNCVNVRIMESFRRLVLSEEIRASAPPAEIRPRVAFATRIGGYELGSIDLLRARSEAPGPEPSLNIPQLFARTAPFPRAERRSSVDARSGCRLEAEQSGAVAISFRVTSRSNKA